MNGQTALEVQTTRPASSGHPHDSFRGYRVTVSGMAPKQLGTVAAVMVELTRHLVDLDGKLEIEIERLECDEGR